jgi:predicted amidohydrolase YtcJ
MFAIMHPARPSEAITCEQAVEAYTRDSAYAEFQEEDKGTIARGQLADLAVLSQDIFTAPVSALPAATSILTMVGGEIVYNSAKLDVPN